VPRNLRRFIAILEVGGGVLGVFLILTIPVQLSGLVALLFLCILVAIGLSCAGGVLLWQGKPLGESLSVISQAFQVPVLYGTGFTYLCHIGLGLNIYLGPEAGIRFYLHIGTAYAASLQGAEEAPALGINVIAASVLFCLLMYANSSGEQRVPAPGSA